MPTDHRSIESPLQADRYERWFLLKLSIDTLVWVEELGKKTVTSSEV